MAELFRFSVLRGIQRSTAPPLDLARPNSSFQTHLVRAAGPGDWTRLQVETLPYFTDHAAWLATLDTLAPLATLRKLLANLVDDLASPQPSRWQALIRDAASALGENVAALASDLADLFLALLIIRAGGPARIEGWVKQRPALRPLVPVLQDRPTLHEVADLLRAAALVQTPASTLQGPDDVRAALQATLNMPPGIFSPFEKPVHAVGMLDLLLVKQHIHHYELGEVARIENILRGETRDHTQKHTLSNETETFTLTEQTTETDQELTSTDHTSISSEVDNTLKEDTKVDGGVHVQYDGGAYKIQSDVSVAYDRSAEESRKFASEAAQDVTQKAAKKVTTRLQQSTRVRVVETFEEVEEQKFENAQGPNVSGVYQWVEKAYLAQVFNYGRRLIFDITVPEPAASLLAAAETTPVSHPPPVPPDPLGTVLLDASGKPVIGPDGRKVLDKPLRPDQLLDAPPPPNSDKYFYGDWVARLQAAGVEPPPEPSITVAKGISDNATDENVHLQGVLNIDDGYAALTFSIGVAWRTSTGKEEDSRFDAIVGPQMLSWSHGQGPGIQPPTGSARNYAGLAQDVALRQDPNTHAAVPLEERAIGFALATIHSETASANIEVRCVRTDSLFAKWQLQAYEKIAARWQQLEADYEKALTNYAAQKAAMGPLGAADPDANRAVERTELKRACVAILDNNNATVRGVPPNVAVEVWPDTGSAPPLPLPEPVLATAGGLRGAEDLGRDVRWFEQAFEWDKIGYIFYPYFWGRRSEWVKRLNLRNDDPLFANFLQAGYARVSIPVRPGFEGAITFYLMTGQPWLGGDLPSVGDGSQNPLYLSIVDELKAQTGAPGDEKPSDQPPWWIRLPTALLKLRPDDALPSWTRAGDFGGPPEDAWTWREDEPPKP